MNSSELKSNIQKNIVELGEEQTWNHNIKLFDGLETSPGMQVSHGKNNVKWERIKGILDLINVSNKRVLDIGCNEGFFSHKIAEMGANVVGGDIDKLRIKKARYVQSILKTPSVDFKILDIYSPEFQALENFDICICMGLIHRVPDPFNAIAAIAKKTDLILFEWKVLKHGLHDDAYAYFSPKGIDKKDFYGTEYWLLSFATLESILQKLGFDFFYRVDDPRQRRGILVAGKRKSSIFLQDDIRYHRGRFLALMTHSKRFIKTLVNILTGKLNS
jgi:SAM-dependent methyltransferase